MKTYILINSSDTIQDCIEIEMDWTCPYLPRIGDTLNASIIMQKLTPKEFVEELSYDAEEQWNKQMADPIGNLTKEQREVELMKEWLLEMDLKVHDVFWGINTEGYYVTLSVRETDKELKRCPFQCGF